MIAILILNGGFVYIGKVIKMPNDELFPIHLLDAHCIAVFGTDKGLGQLANTGATDKTILQKMGQTMHIPLSSVISMIEVNEDVWKGLL